MRRARRVPHLRVRRPDVRRADCRSSPATSSSATASSSADVLIPACDLTTCREPYPSRIVCLTEETTETLYLLGEGDRVVGVSGYTVRPPEARQKPRVSSFLHARFDKIEALEPDLVLAFSDLQADITAELVKRGYPVVHLQPAQRRRDPADDPHARRHRRRAGQGAALADASRARPRRDPRRGRGAGPRRPRVYFEEWDDPLIRGIRWVEELVEIAGGEPIFPELRDARLAKDRIVDPATGASPRARTSSSRRGAASRCGTRQIAPAPDGSACRPCATAASTRSSRRTSCSRDRRRSPKACASCTRSCAGRWASTCRLPCCPPRSGTAAAADDPATALLALLAAAAYGAGDFLGGLVARRATTTGAVVVSQGFGLVLLLLGSPLLPAAQVTRTDVGWGAVAGLTGGVGVALLYRALSIGPMSIVAPVTAICAVLVPVAAGAAFGEPIQPSPGSASPWRW